jgi:hypothetical protein
VDEAADLSLEHFDIGVFVEELGCAGETGLLCGARITGEHDDRQFKLAGAKFANQLCARPNPSSC